LWEKMARASAPDEGYLSTAELVERDPSPGFAFREATLSHRGRG